MHPIVGAAIVTVSATLIAACADPLGPPAIPRSADLARRPPTNPILVPDSIGIPPSIPPIYEEIPATFDDTE